ncbi:MAG: dihydroorotate dehydrogenase B catalytic subunit [Lentisphaerae bacterium GWF2_52_8]|nr:MAG: dihydroorotate dehydrogenase B catalytic subunit [Lentisphaerae bacterium GWF2_52_8]
MSKAANHIDMSVDLGRLKLKNPVMTASGTFGYGFEYAQFFPLEKLGAVVVKGICLKPCHGNPTPRVAEVHGGMLNAIGLQGPGVEKFLHGEEYLPFLRKQRATVIVNIWGRSIEEYAEVASKLDAESEGIHALEINISCPNVKEGGIAFGTDLKLASQVVSEVRRATKLPLITKLSPNVTSVAAFARAVVESGSDMVSLINTITGMAIDIETRRPKIANTTGGLSGPAIKPVALRMVYEVARAVNVPVIGMGGICTGEDAVEFMLAGASGVAVGTAIFSDPLAPLKVLSGLEEYLRRKGYHSAMDIVGKFETGKK